MLPHILKLIANSKHSRQLHGYHIDWKHRDPTVRRSADRLCTASPSSSLHWP
jgi:hypothetical protein